MQEHGPWQIVQSQEVYRDPWTVVRKDDVIRPDGQPGTHTVVTIKPGVCVLAMDDEQHVYLTKEFHYGVFHFLFHLGQATADFPCPLPFRQPKPQYLSKAW